jgi:hypothetical protein
MFALALPIALSAQTPTPAAPAAEKLEVGTWTGTVTPPNGQALALTFAVTAPNDSVKIDLTIADMGMTFPLTAIKLEGRKLGFEFMAGDEAIKCALEKKDDGTFAGSCADGSGQGGPMTMVPPKKGTPTP